MRFEFDRVIQVCQRLLQLACLAQCQGATAPGERVRRLPLQRGAIRGNGLAEVTELFEQPAPIDMRHRIGRTSGRRRTKAFQGLVDVTDFPVSQGTVVERMGIGGVSLQVRAEVGDRLLGSVKLLSLLPEP